MMPRNFRRGSIGFVIATVAALTATQAAFAQEGDDLRQAAQNPIADLISLPFQNNTNFDIGRTDNTQNVLNIQPVIPISISQDWNLIARLIMPVIYQPPFLSGRELREVEAIFGRSAVNQFGIGDTQFGLGDFNPAFFFSPKKPIPLAKGVGLVWGAGPVFAFPTATDDRLGSDKWSAGPTFVTVLLSKKVVSGFLINNLWSYAGPDQTTLQTPNGRLTVQLPDVNAMTLQPFLNYNLPKGWYLTTAPVITANWEANDDNRWTVPVGGGIGRVFKIGKQPINAQISAYYNVVTPDDTGADWQLRTQWTFLFPTH
ncbi:MAG TPA: neuromedin U [Methyloceanibacter sp.]|nr:neuromedin U [Methyloceanibacter sp.]